MVLLFLTVGAFAGQHPVPLDKGVEPAQCLECHADKTKNKVVHSAMALGCTACHEVKTEKDKAVIELSAPVPALCIQCHADKDPASAKGRVHPPAAAGCTKCHDPHSSPNKFQLLKPSSGELCLTCHDKGVKVPENGSRHAALDAGCDTCHITHKTGDPGKWEFAFHLAKGTPALCLGCHDAKDAALVKAHRGQPFGQADCTNCHDPHQSPSSKLINAQVHLPFAERSCDTCHQDPKDGKIAVKDDGKRALCFTCHDSIQKQIETAKVQHPALLAAECTDCHNPHATRAPKLLRADQGQVCAACHEPSHEKVRHGPYDRGQCATCHDAHGNDTPKLLRAEGNALCRGCHVMGENGVKVEKQIVTLPWKSEIALKDYETVIKIGLDRNGQTGHPIFGHPVSGKNTRAAEPSKAAPLSCTSCHLPHTSSTAKLLPRGLKTDIELCNQCHK